MKVYHVTSPKKLRKYQQDRRIRAPVRAWADIFEAVRFSCSTGREIILRLKFPDDAKRLPGHQGNAVFLETDFDLPASLCPDITPASRCACGGEIRDLKELLTYSINKDHPSEWEKGYLESLARTA